MNYYGLRNRRACHRAAAFQLALPGGGGVPLFLAFGSSKGPGSFKVSVKL